ncbi:hypothetical protein MRB53_001262 [Persea americana]|uniref:Uncharacterized protein n=1 Tax=Persea americana TaxID=3435 RepID=A0ACC2MS71_PERAE|nr:hypothetical protein MRB53_001262 [Persea americana]
MCEQWKAESWEKRCRTAAVNRASGAPKGNKALGTYKGGSISQLQHVAAREASSHGQPIYWLDVYVATHDGLPEAVRIVSLDPDELADAVATTAQVRASNELGAGNGKGAKFATIVSAATSSVIGLLFWLLILVFDDKFPLFFTTSPVIVDATEKLAIFLLAFTILLWKLKVNKSFILIVDYDYRKVEILRL